MVGKQLDALLLIIILEDVKVSQCYPLKKYYSQMRNVVKNLLSTM
jgi:hypothetical protein